MQLSNVDLNLLVIFEALLDERSVSGAARKIGMSPSGLSHSLGRLRELFEDPLFLRSGAGMTPTPRAEALAEHVHEALRSVRVALVEAAPFDPETSQQTFRIGASDDVQIMILPALLERAECTAPQVRIEVVELSSRKDAYRSLSEGTLDIAIGSLDDTHLPIRRSLLFETRIVCLARRGHPRVKDRISLEEYLSEGHVAIRPSVPWQLPFTLDGLLHDAGNERRIVSIVSNLAVAPLVVAQSDLLCTAAEPMVRHIAALLDLQILDHPLQLPRQRVHAAWHERTDRNNAHRWFRELLHQTLDELAPGSPHSD